MSSTTEQIKERLGIVDVVSEYIKIEKSGQNYKARCPFHHEKTPSFFISPQRSTFYCFGCGEKGDIFTFVERFEGVDFQGALRTLADKAGIQIVYENKEKKEERDTVYTLLEEATKFFESNLKKNDAAKKYLLDRNLSEDSIEKFRIGYVEDTWSSVYDYLKERGYEDADIEKAGLIKKGDKGYYDRFRSRIMFPIGDVSGRIIAFSGRIFPHSDKGAKYINSPETDLFNKSKTLYGLDKAKLVIRKSNFSIVVEGQMDLLMSHQSGFPNSVAVSGTALTDFHITQLSRLSNNLVLAFDADSAGVASAGRSAEAALRAGMDVKVAKIPEGTDPADLAKEDPEKLKDAIRGAQHIIDFYLEKLSEGEDDKRAYNRKVEQIVLPFVARIPSRIDQMYFVSQVARRLGVSEDIIADEVGKIPIDSARDDGEETVVEVQNQKEEKLYSRKEAILKELLSHISLEEKKKKPAVDKKEVIRKIENIIGKKEFEDFQKNLGDFDEEMLFMSEIENDTPLKVHEEVDDLLTELSKAHLKSAFENSLLSLRDAENKGDQEDIEKALQVCKELSEKIKALAL